MAAEARQLNEGAFTFQTRDGASLCGRVAGTGSRTLIVILRAWLDPDLEDLKGHGYRVIFYDPRGRGCSQLPTADSKLSLEDDLADLAAVQDRVGARHVTVLGWSYYGAVAGLYAARNPSRVDAAVQVTPMPPVREPYFDEGTRQVLARMDAGIIGEVQQAAAEGHRSAEAICRTWTEGIAPAYLHDRSNIAKLRASPCGFPNEHPFTVYARLSPLWASLGNWDWRPELAGSAFPALVVVADSDFQPEAGLREWLTNRGSHLERIQNAGHMVWLDQSAEFHRAVVAFLARRNSR